MSYTAYIGLGLLFVTSLALPAPAAPRDRIIKPVDKARSRVIPGNLHGLAQALNDRGTVDPATRLDYMVLFFKPAPEQQQELDRLLADQQNPSSPLYHRWLSPEEFGNRFGLSAGDRAKVVSWLRSEGFTIQDSSRGGNWVAFRGSAAQVSRSLQTPIHRFQVAGQVHYANTTEPSVPEALADVTWGFLGLNDFVPRSGARIATPAFNAAGSHFLVPEDFATIYNLSPLYKAGIDGTGQNIVVVGQSAVSLSDIRAFRARYNLPANDPKLVPYSTDPGFTGSQLEGNLDLEWAGAIAPNATIYYVYGTSAITAVVAAVSLNIAPVITVSYGLCEIDFAPAVYRSVAQQANAQGITILAASGDWGAAACDSGSSQSFATRGRAVLFPAVMPEVTAVGGTQFEEGNGTYWATTNSANQGSALSYIPETAWNESGVSGLIATGGGPSMIYPRPPWQTGPGLPNDTFRRVPDVSLSAAAHDGYVINYLGSLVVVYGTSASAPSLAAIVAMLNQYQVSKGFQRQPGLGNINPQLYRLAQSSPLVFHDIVSGNNVVSCAQGSPDCLTGSIGYPATAGYDMATGLGSIDANNLVTLWNTQTRGVSVNLVADPIRPTANDVIALSAVVIPQAGGTPTGAVAFSAGAIPLGSAELTSRGGQLAADLFVPAYKLGTGTLSLTAQYSGDATFSGGGGTRTITVVPPTGAASIIPSAPSIVWPASPDAQGLAWQTNFTLREVAGVPAIITAFSIDGKPQPVSRYFPSPNIPANTTVSATVVLRNLPAPVARTFLVAGVDSGGRSWSREFTVNYSPLPPGINFTATATPLVVAQDTSADPGCQWPVLLTIDELGGYRSAVTGLFAGGVNLTSQISSILGTPRLEALGSLQGTVCFGGFAPPATNVIEVIVAGFPLQVTVNFSAPPAVPVKLSTSPARVALASPTALQIAQATLSINVSDKSERWTATVLPTNRGASWLTASTYSGVGPGTLMLSADGTGYGPGAYRAQVIIQSANALPHFTVVPVTFVLGGSTRGTVITGAGNSATYRSGASPGMLLTIFGTKLANTTAVATDPILPYTLAGVSAAVNGIAAPLLYVSANQVNLQVPYEAATGPGVIGINNNGEIAGFALDIASAAPGIFTDAAGVLAASPTVRQGGNATLFLTGAGEVSNLIASGRTQSANTPVASLGRPNLPVTVTVGGTLVFIQSATLAGGQYGTVQVTFNVPASIPTGPQTVVVTVGGVSGPPARITVIP